MNKILVLIFDIFFLFCCMFFFLLLNLYGCLTFSLSHTWEVRTHTRRSGVLNYLREIRASPIPQKSLSPISRGRSRTFHRLQNFQSPRSVKSMVNDGLPAVNDGAHCSLISVNFLNFKSPSAILVSSNKKSIWGVSTNSDCVNLLKIPTGSEI